MIEYYDAICKRKSFHVFRGVGDEKLTHNELDGIEKAFKSFVRLYPDIKTEIRIIPADKVNLKRDAEYCILIYSEKKDNYLMNAGYIGEQLDLYLVTNDIGSLWYGLGKPDEQTYHGLDFVIMFAIHKISDRSKYRKDMFKATRKDVDEIWKGDELGIANIVRFAPSAVNSQPWYVENTDNTLTVYRHKKSGMVGIVPAAALLYFNRIDIGIFLCFLDICLEKNGYSFDRELFTDNGGDDEFTKAAVYKIKDKK